MKLQNGRVVFSDGGATSVSGSNIIVVLSSPSPLSLFVVADLALLSTNSSVWTYDVRRIAVPQQDNAAHRRHGRRGDDSLLPRGGYVAGSVEYDQEEQTDNADGRIGQGDAFQ